LSGRPDVFIYDGVKSSRYFVRKTLASWIALAPRGYGGSSFRFFEAMQLGVVPLFVGDVDTRPFKHFIAWDSCSFYVSRAAEVLRILEKVSYKELETMGQRAQDVYLNSLAFGRWCDLVVKELEMRTAPVSKNLRFDSRGNVKSRERIKRHAVEAEHVWGKAYQYFPAVIERKELKVGVEIASFGAILRQY
jgi:hypothetical protein